MRSPKNILLLMLSVCIMFAASCKKEPAPNPPFDHQIDPFTIVPTNELMGCRWVYEKKIVVDDKSVQMSDTALRRETLIFTSDSTAMYYNDYYAARSEDDVHRTGKCTYEFDGTYGDITLTEKYDNGYNNTLNGWFMYDKGILTWEKSVSDMDSPKVFTRR